MKNTFKKIENKERVLRIAFINVVDLEHSLKSELQELRELGYNFTNLNEVMEEYKTLVQDYQNLINKEIGCQFSLDLVLKTIERYENKITLENVLKNFLGLETRKDYKESNKGNIIELNMNDRCDLAYIRNRFRRYLKSQQPKQLKLFTDYNNGYIIIDENSNIDLNTLEGLNKVINRINLALTEIEANNEKVFGLYDRL